MPGYRSEATLDRQENIAARTAMLKADHIAPLEDFRSQLELAGQPVPFFDPLDGGIDARLLILLETPGPSIAPVRYVSIDNPTGTAANLRQFLSAAGIDRKRIVLWNTVPWITSGSIRPGHSSTKAGHSQVLALLDLLPKLGAVVLAGRTAQTLAAFIAGRLPVFSIGHPSPAHVNTAPEIRANSIDKLAMAKALIDFID